MGLLLITAPTDEPIELAQAKAHLRITHSTEDDYILALIVAARTMVEQETRRALITQTWEYSIDTLEPVNPFSTSTTTSTPTPLYIPLPPLRSVSSVIYTDSAGDSQYAYDSVGSPTVGTSDYVIDTRSQPGRIAPIAGGSWPGLASQIGSVIIRFVAGYGASGDDVPAPLKHAMLLAIGHWFENRSQVAEANLAELPMAVHFLIAPYRIHIIV